MPISRSAKSTSTTTHSPKVYWTVCAALMMLLALTWSIGYVNLGSFNLVVALAISISNALLMALFFMHIVNWRTPVVQQFNIHSIPQVNVYDRSGRLVGTVVGVDFETVKSYVTQAKSSA